MTTIHAEVTGLKDHKARLLAVVADIDARIEDLETNGFPEVGIGDIDEPRRMKMAAARELETAARKAAPESREAKAKRRSRRGA